MRKLKVVLFALTGFGNPVVDSLTKDSRVSLEAVFTIKYQNPFPYYEEIQLVDLCGIRGIPCHQGIIVSSPEGMNLLQSYMPDLIIVSTFKQMIRENVIDLPSLGVVNLHPSLLPKYRGACPSNAVLLNGELVTGITAHYVTPGLDDGDILLQKSINISEIENDGRLRYNLAKLAGELTPDLIDMFVGNAKPQGRMQEHHLASFAPKPTPEDGYLENDTEFETICRKIRAYNPIPGTSVLLGDRRVVVDHFEFLSGEHFLSNGFLEVSDSVDYAVNHKILRMYKKIDAIKEIGS